MVPSPKVATYDLQPEMSAPELTDKAVEAIGSGKYDLIVLNYANPDMVGHTGSLPAAIKAVETVDAGLGRIAEAIRKAGGALLVTADHGNCEMMRDPDTGGPHTSHTTNPVPVVLLGGGNAALAEGRLADIAPTLLELMGLPQPAEMIGSLAPASHRSERLDGAQTQHVRHRIEPRLLPARPQRRAHRAAREDHAVLGLVRRARCVRPARRRSRCDRRRRCRRATTQSRCRRACARRSRRRGRAPSAGRDRRRGPLPPRVRASARCRTAHRSSCCDAFRGSRRRSPRRASCATRLTSAASRLTPMLMLPDLTITARLAASAISFSFSPESPVVPMTWTSPLRATSSARATVAAGMVKSSSPSALASKRLDIGGHLNAVLAEPSQLAGIAADHRRSRRVHRAHQRRAVDRRDGMDERAPHAPAGAGHDQPHVGHECVSGGIDAGIAGREDYGKRRSRSARNGNTRPRCSPGA